MALKPKAPVLLIVMVAMETMVARMKTANEF